MAWYYLPDDRRIWLNGNGRCTVCHGILRGGDAIIFRLDQDEYIADHADCVLARARMPEPEPFRHATT